MKTLSPGTKVLGNGHSGHVVIVKNEFDARRDVRKDVEHEEDDQEERREGMTTAGLGATHFAKRSRSHSIHKIYHKNTVFTWI